MARLILTPAALAMAAKEQYSLDEQTDEKLFIYYRHLEAGDENGALAAFHDWVEAKETANAFYYENQEKHEAWAKWRAAQKQGMKR